MSTPDKCPHCGASRSRVLFDGDVSKYYDCESFDFKDGPLVGVQQSIRCKWNVERAAHAETRKARDSITDTLDLMRDEFRRIQARIVEEKEGR